MVRVVAVVDSLMAQEVPVEMEMNGMRLTVQEEEAVVALAEVLRGVQAVPVDFTVVVEAAEDGIAVLVAMGVKVLS